jgi:hypothetical protein
MDSLAVRALSMASRVRRGGVDVHLSRGIGSRCACTTLAGAGVSRRQAVMRRHVIVVKSPCVANKSPAAWGRRAAQSLRPGRRMVQSHYRAWAGLAVVTENVYNHCSAARESGLNKPSLPACSASLPAAFGQGKSGAAGDDAAVDYGEYRTYL